MSLRGVQARPTRPPDEPLRTQFRSTENSQVLSFFKYLKSEAEMIDKMRIFELCGSELSRHSETSVVWLLGCSGPLGDWASSASAPQYWESRADEQVLMGSKAEVSCA